MSSINNVATASAPWGTVDSQGNWITGAIDRFQFAEAKVPLALLGVDTSSICNGASRFVQVRTRASSTPNSDLKDLTKIFNFTFVPPQNPTQTLAELCGAKFSFGSSVTSGTTPPSWKFEIADSGGQATGVNLTSSGSTTVCPRATHAGGQDDLDRGRLLGRGRRRPSRPDRTASTITVSQSLTSANGCDTSSTGSITVHRGLDVTASLTPHCGNAFDYAAESTGGTGTKSFSWSIQKEGR